MSWDEYDADDFDGTETRGKRKIDQGHDIPNVEIIRETDAAVLVQGEGVSTDPFGMKDKNDQQWFPKSQVHNRSEIREKGERGLFVVSEWIAKQKGLL